MNKAKTENLREKVEGNELDLSLSNLTEVPVKELAALPKATVLDLSCNNLTTLPPEFCTLTHLVKVDLSKNQLISLPEEMGRLSSLQHLDLYNNRLTMLPLSFSQLRSLRWLDLKDNPLEQSLAKAAGDCLDEKQCKQCAARVLQHVKVLQEEADKERERRLLREKELEKKREAKQREKEAKEREAQKKKKAEEKEKKRKEYQAQMAALAAQEQQKKKKEEKKKKASQNQDKKKPSVSVLPAKRSLCSRLFSWILRLLLLLIVGAAGVITVCQVTELRKEPFCMPINLYVHDTVSWAQGLEVVQQVIQKISDLQA
ncbi:leucine-rich repeat-containing protein 59 [Pygocentrus nattereri]|uniref:Leucine-rich repeat-containing protein 59 n=1 Tax=Pygocentrus nattereri TaxID=42514 RepID=A0AAR2KPE9_PYGNA|nr:leucine-rich repeat-containing protein 59 [Pygocentrus nattereri]XP_017558178.1 leucine-rich repeat-containing protein 59 [Pygocentrus nattereri]XP_017558189.1 leucine-rich repeat-containing protein 59 [Pygocentrus nattereri]